MRKKGLHPVLMLRPHVVLMWPDVGRQLVQLVHLALRRPWPM